RRDVVEHRVERVEEAAHHALFDRVRRAVLVVRVAGRDRGRGLRRRWAHAGGTCVEGFVTRTMRSASRPTAIACSDAMSTSNVFAASRKSFVTQSYTSLPMPTSRSVRPTGRNTFSGL